MSEPSTITPVSLSASGYEDGLGRRTLEFDREAGVMLERLHLRPELRAFEAFLRDQVARSMAFDNERFARVRGMERDGRNVLAVVSQFVAGNRLCDLLEAATSLPAHEATSPSVDAAIGFLLDVLPALGELHTAVGHAHGTLGPGRIVLTPTGQLVILDSLFGPAIERLQFNRRRLWAEFGVATGTAGPARLDIAADIGQASLSAMMIVLGRPLRENEYPDGLPALLTEVIEIAQIRGGGPFASGLHAFLQRTLPLPGRQPHDGAEDAAAEVLAVAREIGVARCRSALGAFVEDMNRVLADARDEAEDASADPEDEAITAAVDAFTAELVAESEIAFEDLPAEPAYAADPDVVETKTEPRSEIAFEDLPVEPAYAADPDVVETTPELKSEIAFEDLPVEPAYAADPEVVEKTKEQMLDAIERSASERLVDPATSEWPTSAWPQSRAAVDDEDPVDEPGTSDDESDRFVASTDYAREPVSVVEPEPVPDWRIAPQAEYIPVKPVQPEPAPGIAREPRLADMMEPAPMASPEPVPVAAQKSQAPPSKRKRRGSKGQRDKLRSNAVPAPTPPPVVQAPAPAATIPVAPVQAFSRAPEPVRQSPTPISVKPTPISVKPTPPAKPAPLRIKTEAPSGYDSGRTRPERRESYDVDAMPYMERETAEAPSEFPWRMAGAAFAVMIVLVVVGRAYMPDRGDETATNASTTEAPVAPKRVDLAITAGSITVTTQPAGASVLLDGKAVGETPVTMDGVVPGKHTVTLVTSKGTVKRTVKVEPGKAVKLDLPIYSGMIAVFSPIPLDIAENGRTIGTSEQKVLILSPGRHLLTLTNKDYGYKGTQVVDIDPGEERSISVQPTGDLNANAVPWADVWIDGKKVGETPLAGLKVPLGTHEVVFKNPQFPDRRVTVKVSATAPAAASVDFSKQ